MPPFSFMDCQSLALALQDLSTSIQPHPHSSFVLHRSQCLGLAKSYAVAVQHVTQELHAFLSTCFDSRAHKDLVLILSEMHHTMLQGQEFMCSCLLQDGWVRKSLLLARSNEAQDVCLHDLQWCLCVIHQAIGLQTMQDAGEPADDVFGTLKNIWAKTSQEEDTQILLDALKHEIEGWTHQLLDCNMSFDSRKRINEQLRLAQFLFQRLSRENESAGAPFDALPQFLWVNPLEITIKDAIARGPYIVIHEVEWHGQIFGQKEFFGVDESVFAKEAAIQARSRHPNLLQLICCTSKPSRDSYSLVMELMDMDLRKMIEGRKRSGFDPPFPLLTSVDLMLQIAKGMEHLHSLHIMHRDLKSYNILVNRNKHESYDNESLTGRRMRLKISDFGVSKAKLDQSCRYTTQKAGTSYWMAPEVFDANPEKESGKYTNKADVYSFAMVCFEILSGDVPFANSDGPRELYQRVRRGERPKLPPSCPAYLANYIEKCWEGDPEKRPSFEQISRMFRHLKGNLFSSANPLTSSALSTRGLTLIEDNLQRATGVDWPSTSNLMNISFEMSLYKAMEHKLTNQETVMGMLQSWWSSSATKNLESKGQTSKGFFSKLLPRLQKTSIDELPRLQKTSIDEETLDSRFLIIPEDAKTDVKEYTGAQLAKATNDFVHQVGEVHRLAGEGIIGKVYKGRLAAGQVYKGTLADGQVVAVKVFDYTKTGTKPFLTEFEMLGLVPHLNVVTLLGFCCLPAAGYLMLVYKFVPRGTLRQSEATVLTWAQRYFNIAHGVARALLLVFGIVHRNVTSAQILIYDDNSACLGSFSMAVLA